MKVNEFIEKCRQLNENEISEFAKGRIVNTYMKYEDKVSLCKTIVDQTSHTEVSEGKRVWNKNSTMEYLLVIMKKIEAYTDLDIENPLDDYNLLNKEGYIEELIDAIPYKENVELEDILMMCREDLESNERNIINVLNLLELINK